MEWGRILRRWTISVLMLVATVGCAQHKTDYNSIKQQIQTRQGELQKEFANTGLDHDSVVEVAREYLFQTMTTKVFPAWYGTKWDYNGITTEPRKGHIACGYFVTTTLRDMGFALPRVRWAQLPSETMICEMTESCYIKRYRHSSISHIESQIKTWGDGLYVVGMDSHVGFIVNTDGKLRFVHSDYFNAMRGVISERLNSDNPLKSSKYRVIGKVFTKEMTTRWLKGKEYN